MTKSTFVYVTYIRTKPEKLWSALSSGCRVPACASLGLFLGCVVHLAAVQKLIPIIAGPKRVIPLWQNCMFLKVE
jgi:hypothetical protein